jgi:transposase
VRFFGLDVHRDFCVVAVAEDGELRSLGRVLTTPEELRRFAATLQESDQVAMEATGVSAMIARIIESHVARVVVCKAQELPAARAKTDRLDAQTLARLLAQGYLREVWVPDEFTRVLRRRCTRRANLVRARTRQKNEVHGVLMRTLQGRPPFSDVFGKSGRAWLAKREMPIDERETLEACLRQIDFINQEIALLDQQIACQALQSLQIQRLMSIPGVDVHTASTVFAAIGGVSRFATPRHLVGYIGLDPRVRQSGTEPHTTGGFQSTGPRRRAAHSDRPRGSRCAAQARCACSASASRRAAAHRSRSPPSRASWSCCAGTCSPANRTTPTRARLWCAPRCASCTSRPACSHPRADAARAAPATKSASWPSKLRTPTAG